MWKVGDVEPVRVMGAEGYPYDFNVSTEDGKPVVSFAYASRCFDAQAIFRRRRLQPRTHRSPRSGREDRHPR
jgi:hypothetical protein